MQMGNTVDIQDVIEAQQNFFETNYSYWMEHVLFSFNWWLLIILSIVPWFIWWKFVDKKRLVEISFVGLLSMVVVSFLDLIGGNLLFWTYGFNVVQMILPQITIDLTLLPIINMFLYQLIPKWKPYIIATFFVALFGAFFAEPFFVWMGIYIIHSWEYIYSLPIYIAISIGLKWILQKAKARQEKT